METLTCTPQKFEILAFSYKPSVKKKPFICGPSSPIETQQKFFVHMVQRWVNQKTPDYPVWFLNAFVSKDCNEPCAYWNIGETKNNYFALTVAKRKQFNIGRRLAETKRFNSRDPRWNEGKPEPKIKGYKVRKTRGNYSPVDYEKAMENARQQPTGTKLSDRLKDKLG